MFFQNSPLLIEGVYKLGNIFFNHYISYKKSTFITILAGSYQDDNNINQSVIFEKGRSFTQGERHISPYENIIPQKYSIVPSDDDLKILTIKDKNTLLLTCFDYYDFSVEEYKRYISSREHIDLLVSQCCNNNPDIFLKEAESLHNHIDNITSIICNVSKLKIDNDDYINWGGSSVFGLYDKNSIHNIESNSWRNNFYTNMICQFPEGKYICELELEIPYHSHRMGCVEFKPNPNNIDFVSIDEL